MWVPVLYMYVPMCLQICTSIPSLPLSPVCVILSLFIFDLSDKVSLCSLLWTQAYVDPPALALGSLGIF